MNATPGHGGVAPGPHPVRQYVRGLIHDQRRALGLCVSFGVLCLVALALVPAVIGRAVDDGIIARDRRAIVLWGCAVLGLGAFQAFTSILRDRYALTNQLAAAYQTVQALTRQGCRLGASLPKCTSTGEAVALGVVDVTSLGRAFAVLGRGAGAAAAVVTVGTLMLVASWKLGLVVLVGVPLLVWALAALVWPLRNRQQRLRELQGELTELAVDIASGLRVLRGIGGEDVFAARYRESSRRVQQQAVAVAKIEAWFAAAKVLLPGLLTATVVWIGARFVLTGQITPGQLVSFYAYAIFLAYPLRWLTTTADVLTRGHIAARRIVDFLALAPELVSGRAAAPGAAADLVDHDSGLVVRHGRLTAVACADPADASLLADRLGRYLDASVSWGDAALADLPIDEVRRRILVMDNDARLFAGQLRAELVPVDGAASDEQLRVAAETASAWDIVAGLPDGLDAMIAPAGRNLSGGQRQRLCLVRALLFDPEVLILVQPTSAVDVHTEARIAAQLVRGRVGRTTVVFTTSPAVLDRADQVAYVEATNVVLDGRHDEMLTDARYRSAVLRGDPA